jgi:hypothetical protein
MLSNCQLPSIPRKTSVHIVQVDNLSPTQGESEMADGDTQSFPQERSGFTAFN